MSRLSSLTDPLSPFTPHPSLPVCCAPRAFQTMRRVAGDPHAPDALELGAGAIAGIGIGIGIGEAPQADPRRTRALLDAHAHAVRRRVRSEHPAAVLAHLHAYLFDDLGFRGDVDHYHDAVNSSLPAVLRRRRGLPITLTLVYKLLGDRLGLAVHGVGLPGHFVAGVACDGSTLYVDPFHAGRVLSQDDLAAIVRTATAGTPDAAEPVGLSHVDGWPDPNEPGASDPGLPTLDPSLLMPVSPALWLSRMLQNLLYAFNTAGRWAELASVIELQMALWPDHTPLRRDLSLVLARMGMTAPAAAWLASYLSAHPEDPQRDDLEQLLAVLRP